MISLRVSNSPKHCFRCWSFLLLLLGAPVAATASDQLTLSVSPARNVLKAGEKHNEWIRVGLKGFTLDSDKKRPGVNLAIVLDKSGSMRGEKIRRAQEAAIDAIGLLQPTDIVSILTYDSTVHVLVPATKLTDKLEIIDRIRSIGADGNTALFAGVSKGAAEVRKFLDKERVNRVILLSDGMANVGPSSPGELGNLGKSLIKENITVSTLGLGLGYNEDLMVQLAGSSGGNHLFIEDAAELADVFRNEFNDALSVVAQEIEIRVNLPEGIRPIRVLGSDADITGQKIVTQLAQVYSDQDRYLAVEIEVPASEEATRLDLATVSVTYANMKTHEQDKLSATAKCEFSTDEKQVSESVNSAVMADVVLLVSSEQSKLATMYLDQGNLEMCRQCLEGNVKYLRLEAMKCPENSDKLMYYATQNATQLFDLKCAETTGDKDATSRFRKSLRGYQIGADTQQRLEVSLPEPGQQSQRPSDPSQVNNP
ncbi:MAG: VWA domain-containing protein [Planctomycetaceae bacterium]